MTSKNKQERIEQDNLSTDFSGFLQELRRESERGAVLVGAAFLDEQLRHLLTEFLIDEGETEELMGVQQPLGTFGARIRMAYCMGLLTRMDFADLKLIQKIRNKFAHHLHGLSFDAANIKNLCEKLQGIKQIPSTYTESPRRKYEMAVALLMVELVAHIEAVSKNRCNVLPPPEADLGSRIGPIITVPPKTPTKAD